MMAPHSMSCLSRVHGILLELHILMIINGEMVFCRLLNMIFSDTKGSKWKTAGKFSIVKIDLCSFKF